MTHEQKPESAALPGLAYFSELITLKRGARSLRDVAPEIGISVATISRIESGKTPDLITFATLCRWLEMSPDVFLARYEPGKPPIKIEQKPESAEFRTREAHRRSVAQAWQDEGMGQLYAEALADAELSEAEARGAAEQRRKDAEGAEQPTCYVNADRLRWHLSHGGSYMTAVSAEPVKASVPHHNLQDGLYLRPANVAALEARVKELEGEVARLKKPEFYAVSDLEDSWLTTGELMDSLDGDIPHFETVEIDCFRRVSRIWAFYDGKKVREFADKKEAEFAAAAAIREGGE